jgi:hypothetical protein
MAGRHRDGVTPADPYEHGFEAVQRQRLQLPPAEAEGGPLKRPPRVSWRWLVIALAVVAAIAIGRGLTSSSNALHANCSKAQVAVSEKSVTSHGSGVLNWSATAPAGTRYAVAINAGSVTASGSSDQPTAEAAGAGGTQVSRLQAMPHGCLAHGVFGVLVEPGNYRVTLFTFTGNVGVPAASTRVRVTKG